MKLKRCEGRPGCKANKRVVMKSDQNNSPIKSEIPPIEGSLTNFVTSSCKMGSADILTKSRSEAKPKLIL